MPYILLQFTENVISHQAEGNLFQVGWNTESSTSRVFRISTILNHRHRPRELLSETLKCSSLYHVLVFIERRVLNAAIYKTNLFERDLLLMQSYA